MNPAATADANSTSTGLHHLFGVDATEQQQQRQHRRANAEQDEDGQPARRPSSRDDFVVPHVGVEEQQDERAAVLLLRDGAGGRQGGEEQGEEQLNERTIWNRSRPKLAVSPRVASRGETDGGLPGVTPRMPSSPTPRPAAGSARRGGARSPVRA